MQLIENHPSLGLNVELNDGKRQVKGSITGVRRSHSQLWDVTTMTCIDPAPIEIRIKPDDGSRAFWVGPFRSNDPVNQPRAEEVGQ